MELQVAMFNLYIHLPIANFSVHMTLLLGLGLSVGFLAGLFGVGGGFLMTPLLMMIGIPPTVAAASDANQIVAATSSGTFAHWRLGNVDFKMGLIMVAGGIAGGTIGVQFVKVLRAAGEAGLVIKLTYVVLLAVIGTYMFQDSLKNLRRRPLPEIGMKPAKKSWFGAICDAMPVPTRFEKSGITISVFVPIILGGMVGVLSALLGVGGGFIMVPVMVYLLRMPMHVVVGTNLFQEVFICINVTFMQAYYNHTVDLLLALFLLLGSATGAQLGARISNRLKADQLKIVLATIVLLVMLRIVFGLLIHPGTEFSLLGGE
jgi:uncharacterized membrane protein YfcA